MTDCRGTEFYVLKRESKHSTSLLVFPFYTSTAEKTSKSPIFEKRTRIFVVLGQILLTRFYSEIQGSPNTNSKDGLQLLKNSIKTCFTSSNVEQLVPPNNAKNQRFSPKAKKINILCLRARLSSQKDLHVMDCRGTEFYLI